MPKGLGASAKVRSTRPARRDFARVINSPSQPFAPQLQIAYDPGMEQARMDRAMARIEGALARIEAVRTAPPALDTASAEAHAAFRTRVESALGKLDSLIGSLEQ